MERDLPSFLGRVLPSYCGGGRGFPCHPLSMDGFGSSQLVQDMYLKHEAVRNAAVVEGIGGTHIPMFPQALAPDLSMVRECHDVVAAKSWIELGRLPR